MLGGRYVLEALYREGVFLFLLSLLAQALSSLGTGGTGLGRVSHIGVLVVIVGETLVNVSPRCGVAVLIRSM